MAVQKWGHLGNVKAAAVALAQEVQICAELQRGRVQRGRGAECKGVKGQRGRVQRHTVCRNAGVAEDPTYRRERFRDA